MKYYVLKLTLNTKFCKHVSKLVIIFEHLVQTIIYQLYMFRQDFNSQDVMPQGFYPSLLVIT